MGEQCCFRRRQWMSKVERGTVLGLLAFAFIYPRTIELSTQENNTSNLISLNEHVSRPALVLATSRMKTIQLQSIHFDSERRGSMPFRLYRAGWTGDLPQTTTGSA